MSSSRPDTAATNRDVDSKENISKFTWAREATTYDNLLLDGRISNADVRNDYGMSGLHWIAYIGRDNKGVDTDILLSYLLTCDPPADINGRTRGGEWGLKPISMAAFYNNTSAVKVLIDFGGDRTIKTYSNNIFNKCKKGPNKLLMECFPSEE